MGVKVAGRRDKVSRNSVIPLYRQVADAISADIQQGLLRPGESVGSEPELMERFSVSRVTARHATEILMEAGLVERHHGKGTFVKMPALEYPLGELRGTLQVASERWADVAGKILSINSDLRDSYAHKRLGIPANESVSELWRRDTVSGKTVAVSQMFLPTRIISGISKQDMESDSLYPLLEKAKGIRAQSATQTMRAAGASAAVAELLGLRAGDPIMHVERVTSGTDGTAIEFSIVYFRSDAVDFTVDLTRGDELASIPPWAI